MMKLDTDNWLLHHIFFLLYKNWHFSPNMVRIITVIVSVHVMNATELHRKNLKCFEHDVIVYIYLSQHINTILYVQYILLMLLLFLFSFWDAVPIYTTTSGKIVTDHCRWEQWYGCTPGCKHSFQKLCCQKLVTYWAW